MGAPGTFMNLLHHLFPDHAQDYVVLCHGRVSTPELTLRQPLYWAEGTHLPTVVRSDLAQLEQRA